MLSVQDLPALNAGLNAASAVMLGAGYICIRRRWVIGHRLCMMTALLLSVCFLGSYLVYHAKVGSVKFQGQGGIRLVYFAILLTHTVLATAVVPLVAITVNHAWRERFDRHRRIARWTLPIWGYVSVTGVVVYCMLYLW